MRSSVALVTGGAGFIGTHLVRRLLRDESSEVVNVDKLTYAAAKDWHTDLDEKEDRYSLVELDASDYSAVAEIVDTVKPTVVMNLAAETHVDSSIDHPSRFVESNYVATHALLEACLGLWRRSGKPETFRYLQVSTDEVYGDRRNLHAATPGSQMVPSSPYAATKAGADLLVGSYCRTYGFPGLVTHSSNNFGPGQHPEKFIPMVIATALTGLPIPIYGDGRQTRDWIFVLDNVEALIAAAQRGEPGQHYLIAGGNSLSNLEVAMLVCEALDQIRPREDRRPYSDQMSFVEDRPGHDFAYELDDQVTRTTLSWEPVSSFAESLTATAMWFVEHESWWRPQSEYEYQRQGIDW